MDGKFFSRSTFMLFLIGSAVLVGCGTKVSNSVRSTTTSCVSSAVPKSFIVKWKNTVPKEFQSYRLDKRSRYTRFTNTDKDTVTREVMGRYPDEVVLGESDLRIEVEDLQIRSVHSSDLVPSATTVSNWGFFNIEAETAWNSLGKSGDGMVVAVVDTGADLTHPALAGQFFVNNGETGIDSQGRDKRTNRVDDDGNGFVDDVTGYDFGDGDADVTDNDGHGTHVAGIIAARKDSSVTGVAPNARILPIKFLSDKGTGFLGAALQGLEYAQRMGAPVVNASWAGACGSSSLREEITQLSNSGIILANSAGNSGQDLSRIPEWPAVYQAANKITIGSSDRNDLISRFSNYGVLTDLVAPGGEIASTHKNGSFATLSGTSMASPFVAGVAALIWSAFPSASANEVVSAINDSAVFFNYPVRTRGRLNAKAAANLLSTRLQGSTP